MFLTSYFCKIQENLIKYEYPTEFLEAASCEIN